VRELEAVRQARPEALRHPHPVRSREIDFVKVSPTQNMTLLVRSEHPVEEYRGIAAALMSAGHVHAEQVGFVRKPTSPGAHAGLRMAADEFCGNACMALAAVSASEEGPGAAGPTDVVLETSGADDVVRCRVERRYPDYFCELAVPLPRRVEPWAADGGSALVLYEDALHVVIEADRLDQETRDRAQATALRLGESWSVPLIGVMVYESRRKRLTPLVHIPSLDCMVWERSCGSGTGALGAYLALKERGPIATEVTQPGGTMRVTASCEHGRLAGLTVAGSVRIVAEGKAYVHA
jgi:diaminopimelate epimerase